MHAESIEGKMESETLDLELQAVVSSLMYVLGTEPGASIRVYTLKH